MHGRDMDQVIRCRKGRSVHNGLRGVALLLLACAFAWPLTAVAQLAQSTITTIAGGGSPVSGNGDGGPATSARLAEPIGVAVDAGGNVYVAERYSTLVRKINAAGVISTVAGNGSQMFNGDGIPATAAGLSVAGIAVDATGNLYIADNVNRRVRKVATNGIISTLATGPDFSPSRVAVDGAGVVYASSGLRVYRIGTGGALQVVAGSGEYGTAGDGGPATQAKLVNTAAIAFDRSGRLHIAGGERVRRVDANGTIRTVAGGGPFKIDPIATSYRWIFPYGLAFDSRNNLYVANGTNVVRVVSAAGIADNAAGQFVNAFGDIASAPFGFEGDGGPATAALLHEPESVAVDQFDNVYVADSRNNRIRKLTPVPTPRTPLGVGAFAPFRNYAVGSHGMSVAVADFTGDGRDDAVMLTSDWGAQGFDPVNDGLLNLFVQQADRTLAAPLKYRHYDGANYDYGTVNPVSGPAVGDLNGDGRADVVVGGKDGIRIFLGRADGLAPGVRYPGVAHAQVAQSVVVVDANGDGHLDVVTLSGGRAEGGSYPDDQYGLLTFLGNGTGGIGSKTFVPMQEPYWGMLQVHDINGDGRLDIIGRWADTYRNEEGMYRYRHGVAWKLRQPAGGFGAMRSTSIDGWNSTHPYTVGDMDGDGRKDIVMAASANMPNAYYVLLSQDASGNFAETRRWDAFDVPQALLARDMNGDRQDDLVVVHGGWHAIGLHVGTGIGLDTEIKYYIDESSNQNFPALATGDLNGDGCRDVAMGDRNYGLVVLTGTDCMVEMQDSQPLLPPKPPQVTAGEATPPGAGPDAAMGPISLVARSLLGSPLSIAILLGIGALGFALRFRR